MAYADSISRSRTDAGRANPSDMSAADTSTRSRRHPEPSSITEPEGRAWERGELARAGLLGGALAIGVLLGAGAALLLAPQTGEEMRADIADGTRRLRHRAGDAWEDLRDELRFAARRGRRRMRRGVTRSGWAAEDAIDRGRRKIHL